MGVPRKARTPKETPEYAVNRATGAAVAVDFPTATILELPAAIVATAAAATLEGGVPVHPAVVTTTTLEASVTTAAAATGDVD